MKHVFRATRIGWDRIQEGVYFDAEVYTKESAEAEFKPFQGVTRNGYPYTGYEYDGVKYHDIFYLGLYEDDQIPRSTEEYIDSLINRGNK